MKSSSDCCGFYQSNSISKKFCKIISVKAFGFFMGIKHLHAEHDVEHLEDKTLTMTLNLAGLATAQAAPLLHDDGITLRYDAGRDSNGDPVVFAVIDSEDLCQLPVDVLSGLGVGPDRADRQGDPVFFAGRNDVMRLYVDTDAFPNFKADLVDIADDHGIRLYDAIGDLKALCGTHGDIAAPDMPAYVHAGFERISSDVALSMLVDQRRDLQSAMPRKDENGSGSEFC